MVTVTIINETISFEIMGWHKLWSLKSKLIIPRENIVKAYQDASEITFWKGLRMPGTEIPGLLATGTFYKNGRIFRDASNKKNTIVITLREYYYKKLIIEVQNPQLALQKLNNLKMKCIYILLFSALWSCCFAQNKNFTTSVIDVNPLIKGTLYTPNEISKSKTLVIIIAGSGPTDRDGNQRNLVNNSLKFLCEGVASNAIHAFSYDKRMFAMAQAGKVDEASLSFNDFITDANDVVQFFKNEKKYKKIVIIGHSEGALIGLVAANQNTDAYISIAGAGRGIDAVILEQIALQAPFLKDEVQQNLEILKTGKTFELKNQMLASIFRPSVQPYMISWLKYQPQEEIKKLQIPILIINGTKDLQVSVADAQLLQQAKPTAKLVIINNMNHVFKDISGDDSANKASYNNPELPNSSQLLDEIISFIKNLNM